MSPATTIEVPVAETKVISVPAVLEAVEEPTNFIIFPATKSVTANLVVSEDVTVKFEFPTAFLETVTTLAAGLAIGIVGDAGVRATA